MKKMFLLVILGIISSISACSNLYEIETYETTNSYGSVFEGKYVPQDVR